MSDIAVHPQEGHVTEVVITEVGTVGAVSPREAGVGTLHARGRALVSLLIVGAKNIGIHCAFGVRGNVCFDTFPKK